MNTPQTPLRTEGTPSSPGTILVIEDEELVRGTLAQVLARHGYTVLTSRDGVQAIETATAFSGPIDVAISDMIMPGMNGLETVRQLRASHPNLRVLIISGYFEDPEIRRQIEAENLPLLPKPFSAEEVVHRVADLLRTRR